MKTECKVCTVMCDILSGNELRTCAFEHKSICPFDARYLDLSEHDKQVRADAIDEYTNMLIEYNENHYFDELSIEDLRKMANELKEQNK